tara:strand:+ start:7603 stop:7914 length:312 start_codon:yes stop_codon:yes gene_type:complete
MNNTNPITKISQIIQRKDGSEIKITATEMYGLGLQPSIDFYVHHRENSEQQWKLLGKRPHTNSKNMSVDDYVKYGRPEYLNYVSHGEILKVISFIGKPMNILN